MEQVFAQVRPDIVFHTAAHKHVPLMEHNVADAVSNNVDGTRVVLDCCKAFDVSRFVFISTDKAVAPTSMLGATKHVAELLVRDAAVQTGKAYTTVRFGNVLGSRGSMLHVFRRQIAQGGPLTITHPEVRRYFMTVSEAVHLVLQAAAMSKGGEVFVLDMGSPIRIVDLVRDLLLLSGVREGQDIDLIFTGLRPGEKLSEQLFSDDERFTTTAHEKILVCQYGTSAAWTEAGQTDLMLSCDALIDAARQGNVAHIVHLMEGLVPGYTPGEMLRAVTSTAEIATLPSD
jgi:FlaA1/EpsC-like NDP-sugar epimerase